MSLETPTRALRRVLGAAGLTSLGIGGIIGTGIFVIAGAAAKEVAGPAILLSFLVAALACGCAALCYAKLAGRFQEAGSAYAYARALCPPRLAWLVGWNLILQYVLAAASIAQGWSHYFQDALAALAGKHLALPALLTGTGRGRLDLPALLIVVVLSTLLLRGIVLSTRVNHAIVVIKLAIVVLVIGVGAAHINPTNWVPFAPYGWVGASKGMLAGAAMVVYAFLGFEALTNYSEESHAPQRDIPKSILRSLAICTALYMAMAFVLTGMVRYDHLSKDAPISEAFGQLGLPWIRSVVAVGALIGITSVLLVILLSLPRVLLAISRENILSRRWFGQVQADSGAPRNATLASGLITAVLAALVPLDALGVVAVMANLVTFLVVAALVVRLEHQASLAPLITVLMSIVLLSSLPWFGWPILGLWWISGAILYQTRHKQNPAFKG